MAAAQPKPYTVTSHDCGTDDAKINELAAIVETQQEGIYPPDGVEVPHFTRGAKKNYIRPFDYRVMPWTVRCTDNGDEIRVRHYVARMNGDKEIVGWLVAQRRSDEMPRGTARIYLSEISTIRIRKPEYRGVADALLTQFRKDAVEDPAVTFVYLYPLRPELEPVYKARDYLNYRELSTTLHTAPNTKYDIARHMFLLTKEPAGKGINDIIPDALMGRIIADVRRPRIDTMAEVRRIADRAAANKVEGAVELVDLLKGNRLAIQDDEKWKELQNELDNFNMFEDEPNPMSEEEKIDALLGVVREAVENKRKGGRRKTHRLRFLRKHHMTVRGYSLGELAKTSKVPQPILRQVYDRGIGAYKTNPTSVRMKGTFRKGVKAPYSKKLSKEQWAMARVYSFLDGNPKHDTDLRRKTRRRHK